MSVTVFYMNPGATEAVCDIVRREMPPGWRLTVPADPDDFAPQLAEADYVLIATEPLNERHLAAAPRLKLIQHQGVGYEKIDLAACRRRGVPVALTPEGTSVGVAEHTILLILAVYKRLLVAAGGIARGQWMQWSLRQDSYELSGKTLGLVGFGRIGREVARRAAAFDARVWFYDPHAAGEIPAGVGRAGSLEELLAGSDVVSLHLPETAETRHLFDADRLAQMKPGAVLINAARGGLIDERALFESIRGGHLGGAGLDVFEREPVPPGHPLLSLPGVVATPHIAAGTRDALATKMRAAFANMLRRERGEPLMNVVPELSDAADDTAGRT